MGNRIDPRAVIDTQAELGEEVVVGPFSVIGPQVKIGAGTVIGSHVVIERFTEIGPGCKISHGAVIGTPPQDYKYMEGVSFVRIGSENDIREFVTIHRSSRQGESTIIGNRNLFMAYSHVAHDCIIGDDVILTNYSGLSGYVTVEDGAIISGLVGVHQFVRIGTLAMISGMTRVSQDIVPYVIAEGNPAEIKGLNSIGLRRKGFSAELRLALKRAFKLLFRYSLNTTQALDRIKSEVELFPEIDHLIEFIAKSERGICK